MNCQICGAELPSDALFCGECGSSTSATPRSRQRYDPRPSDTTVIQPLVKRQSTGVISVSIDTSSEESSAIKADADAGEQLLAEDLAALNATVPNGEAGEEGAGSSLSERATPELDEAPILPDEPVVSITAPRGASAGVSFVLQFSTGESFDVAGNGLIGRRPLPLATERFDHLIQINDPGRSVSKSHLEFGLHNAELWISDRASGNGTSLRRTDGATMPCEPGRRYLVERGARVEIGEQFFVVA